VTVLVLGVSGSGKTTVGKAVAELLGVPFVEGDDFQPAANLAKMSAGQALDADRGPWLRALADRIRHSSRPTKGWWSPVRPSGAPTATAPGGRPLPAVMPVPVPVPGPERGVAQPDESGLTLDATAAPRQLTRVRTAVGRPGEHPFR
jgi:gluconokinase